MSDRDLAVPSWTPEEDILRVQDLVKHFPLRSERLFQRTRGEVQAVDGVSIGLRQGETLGLVGESGCGKSTLARLLMRLHEPTAGQVLYKGRNVSELDRRQLRRFRRSVQMIFQDPYASLNPRKTAGTIVTEPWRIHKGIVPVDQHRVRGEALLERVGLSPSHFDSFPHEFSGGQRQRIGVARALAVEPKVIVCDEPVSALDVSVQAQILNLLKDLQEQFSLSYVFVAHDLSVVRHISNRVAVMYLGRIVEVGEERDLYDRPTHPYTQALLSAVPNLDFDNGETGERILLHGDLPSPSAPPSGCRFRTRCWKAETRCADEVPMLEDRHDDGHLSACHFPDWLD